MEIIFLFIGWLILLYIIHLNRELSTLRKYNRQHDNIYVPSYEEIINQNRSIQVIRFLSDQFSKTENKIFRIRFPYIRKKINFLNTQTILEKKLD